MIETVREFAPADRYVYDCGMCSTTNGFAQFDTRQDASYFGTWVSPTKRAIVNYCEGDVTLTKCETDEEFTAEVRRFVAWNEENGWGPARIDPGFSEELKLQFTKLGLKDLLH